MKTWRKGVVKDLQEITKDCRDDMHEPDEQGVSAVVTGWRLDNAMGADPLHNFGEFTVGITRDLGKGDSVREWFNLADLIALAKMAKVS